MNGKQITNVLFVVVIFFGAAFLIHGLVSGDNPTEQGLNKIDTFLNKCTDQYQITIANDQYQFKCDAGYILVEPYVLDAFNKRS